MPLPPPSVPTDPPPQFQLASPPPPPWHLAPPPADERGIIVVRLIIGFAATLLAIFSCTFCKGYRNSREARAATPQATQELPPGRAAGTSPAARLPAFTYSRSVKHNVTGAGDQEAALFRCSVCFGVFQLGEKVRLLPVCLHLYHVECIDPWLDTHSTCPLCRSDTDATAELGRLPPV
ncbi:LOW QUALITY PROTEIN: RING-H2 finger protein ATL32 [Brachypodium distachyon]|uniref:LOW QUALITY PROTEIN: RING-H2 finger protein ATL32 n=1 Tax=Brachypodium distachyon TaxID=15368 RepID=UPI000D0DCB81|nr:LOW QUALITY PROTEIN: RING-H2 finger protein ATL32 [Brachypodium distachyon]|eukprot:XP_010233240.2 LOW QUALITY PROTEIN: RING-H2 finger protein ATL32 [Brachypodium distachyon]